MTETSFDSLVETHSAEIYRYLWRMTYGKPTGMTGKRAGTTGKSVKSFGTETFTVSPNAYAGGWAGVRRVRHLRCPRGRR